MDDEQCECYISIEIMLKIFIEIFYVTILTMENENYILFMYLL